MAVTHDNKQIDKIVNATFGVSSKINGKTPKYINGIARSFKFTFNKISVISQEDACSSTQSSYTQFYTQIQI